MLPKLEQGVKRMTERGKREEVQGEAERGDNNKKKKIRTEEGPTEKTL